MIPLPKDIVTDLICTLQALEYKNVLTSTETLLLDELKAIEYRFYLPKPIKQVRIKKIVLEKAIKVNDLHLYVFFQREMMKLYLKHLINLISYAY